MPDNTAIPAYIRKIGEIEYLAALFTQFAEDNGNVAPDDVTWNNVCILTTVIDHLSNAAFRAGILTPAPAPEPEPATI